MSDYKEKLAFMPINICERTYTDNYGVQKTFLSGNTSIESLKEWLKKIEDKIQPNEKNGHHYLNITINSLKKGPISDKNGKIFKTHNIVCNNPELKEEENNIPNTQSIDAF